MKTYVIDICANGNFAISEIVPSPIYQVRHGYRATIYESLHSELLAIGIL